LHAKGQRKLLLPGSADAVTADIYDRTTLAADTEIAGPAIVEQTDTTTLVLPGWRAKRIATGDIIMTYSG
jgi:N-methylhydantoinase A